MSRAWHFHSAGEIVFGRGAVQQLGGLARRLGIERVVVVTDTPIIKAGLLTQVVESLVQAGVAANVFDGGEPEPSLTAVQACVKAAQKSNAQALVSVGGGSNTDLAKAATTLLAHGGSIRDYFGEDRVPGPVGPLIAVSTTAGTGSEVSGAAVLTDKERHLRASILSNYIRPTLALFDPLLTVTCPPRVTADAGIDALTHAIEAYLATDYRYVALPEGQISIYNGKFPLADCLAVEAMRLIGANLRLAVHQGTNLEARENMHLASLLAGMSFSNAAVALVHAIEYPIGMLTHCTHGAGNGLLLPYVMEYNMPARQRELREIAVALGENVDGLTDYQAAERAVAAVRRLEADIGTPMRLRDLGLPEEQIPGISQEVVGLARLMRNNPRPPTEADVAAILRAAW